MEPIGPGLDAARSIVLVLLGIGILLHLIFAVAAGLVAKSKERSFAGWLLLGVFFGLFAFLLSLCVPKGDQPFGAGNVVAIVLLVGAPIVLLPCLAIIGAISVPNFLEAQSRSKVSRAKAEMRNLSVNLEMYYVDHNAYPPAESYPAALTSPVPYTTRAPKDPFAEPPKDYGYRPQPVNNQEGWILWSVGPDGVDNDGEIEYDASNGTTSGGDIIRYADRF